MDSDIKSLRQCYISLFSDDCKVDGSGRPVSDQAVTDDCQFANWSDDCKHEGLWAD